MNFFIRYLGKLSFRRASLLIMLSLRKQATLTPDEVVSQRNRTSSASSRRKPVYGKGSGYGMSFPAHKKPKVFESTYKLVPDETPDQQSIQKIMVETFESNFF